jgi:hypothetical protein
MTAQQALDSLLALFAFVPTTVCSGYVVAWFTNLHGFRDRSIVERIFWSLPLSLAVSTISSVLIGKFLSLTAVVVFYWMMLVLWLVLLVAEGRRLRHSGGKWNLGWRPLGGKALALVILWIAGAILSLVDIQKGHQLFMNVAMLDQSYRVNWTESVLHTGVPPANPLYMYKHPAPMRNYYFWYVLCAAVAKMSRLPVRAAFTASCVWAGLALAGLIGLYLKYFLAVGARLRRQFLLSIALLTVTGLDLPVVLWNLFRFHIPPPADLEAWSRDGIPSWLHTLLWAPHHLVSMLCCMLALLLAWMTRASSGRSLISSGFVIAFALSSAFGLSIYVTFAFLLVAVVWAVWQLIFERSWRPPVLLACGGAGGIVLLIPYLRELTHSVSGSSATTAGASAPLFSIAVRQMIPPDVLLRFPLFDTSMSTETAGSVAKILLLVPGYALEFGLFFVIFLVMMVPAWRSRVPLTPAQRCLLFIAATMTPFMSLIRSGVLQTNDFAWRASMFVQFPLLLLASEVVTSWDVADGKPRAQSGTSGLPGATPHWLRATASFALIIGIIGTAAQALEFRFLIPLHDGASRIADPYARSFGEKAYISDVGYAELNRVVPPNAVVQFNPEDQDTDRMAMMVDMLGVRHQAAISDNKGACGSEIGGDPSGCPILAAAIDALYNGASAEQARATCRQFGIQYLVARVYDPIWKDKSDWVWTLPAVVSWDDFRAVGCG